MTNRSGRGLIETVPIPEHLPLLLVDPRPYPSVTIGWRGVWVTFLATEDAPAGRRASAGVGDEEIIVVRPPGPPISAKFAGDPRRALLMEVDELRAHSDELDLTDIKYTHFLDTVAVDEGETGVLFVSGNVVDLDTVAPLVEAAMVANRPLVIRLSSVAQASA